MAEEIIAYCGLVCSDCPGFIATQSGDLAALERVAAQWSKEFNATLTVVDCTCDGCLGEAGRKGSHCAQCDVRACAVGRGMVNCAHCDDYGCETITHLFGFAPEAKVKLDQIRASLMAG